MKNKLLIYADRSQLITHANWQSIRTRYYHDGRNFPVDESWWNSRTWILSRIRLALRTDFVCIVHPEIEPFPTLPGTDLVDYCEYKNSEICVLEFHQWVFEKWVREIERVTAPFERVTQVFPTTPVFAPSAHNSEFVSYDSFKNETLYNW